MPPTNQVVYLGDSLMLGNHVSAGQDIPSKLSAEYPPIAANASNQAIGSTYANEDITHTDGGQGVTADGMFNAGVDKPICMVWFGANDLVNFNAATFFAAYKAYCQARASAGYLVIACTALPNTAITGAGHESDRLSANTSIRGDTSFYHALADFASDPIMGLTATNSDTTYYSDGVHPTNTGNNLLQKYALHAVQQVLGVIALVDHTIAQASGGAAVTTTAINSTGANLITVVVFGFTGTNPIGNVTDNKSNGNATALTPYLLSSDNRFELNIFYWQAPTVGTGHQFTVGAASTFCTISVAAWSGAASSGVFDVQSAGNDNHITGTPQDIVGGSVTPNQDNSLIIYGNGFASGNSTATGVDSSFTILDQLPISGGNAQGGSLSYLIQTSAAAVNPDLSLAADGAGSGLNAVFKPSAGTVAYTLTADGGSYEVSGQDATLTKTGSTTAYTLTAAGGSYAITGGRIRMTWSGAVTGNFPQAMAIAVMGL